jgi:hypothetical protein
METRISEMDNFICKELIQDTGVDVRITLEFLSLR